MSDENFCVFDNAKLIKTYLEEHNFYKRYKIPFRKYQIKLFYWHSRGIPEESFDKYLKCCKKMLSQADYNDFLNEIKLKNSFLENIFSVKNKKFCGKKVKQITILGWKIDLNKINNKGEGCVKG